MDTNLTLSQKKSNKRRALLRNIWIHKAFYLMLLPGIVYLIMFRYIPMYGVTLAFKEMNLSEGLYGGTWAGFKYFKEIFKSTMFLNALRNTLVISSLKIVTNMAIPVALALFMNEISKEWYKRTLQTAIYMPRFVSWVVYGGIVIMMLSPETGVLNSFIKLFGGNPVYFFSKPQYFKAIVIITDILKEAGWGAVVYIAAISAVDVQQYEAAIVDGASKIQRIRYITLPGIANTIIVMLVIKVGYLMSVGIDQIYNLYNPMVFESGDVLDTLVLRSGIQEGNISFGTAAGLFQSSIGFLLVLITNWIARKYNESSLL